MTDAAATNASGCVNDGGKRAALECEQAVKSALRRGFLTGFVKISLFCMYQQRGVLAHTQMVL
eukprot:11026341-Ditylum_brightwellii.AAC.1